MPRTKEQFAQLRKKKKEVILKTAIKLFAKKGYENTSINDIAKAAKISTGLTYHYFKNKQKILEAIIEQWIAVGDKIFQVSKLTDDPLQKIRSIIESVFDFLIKNEELMKLYISFLVQPGVLKNIRKIALNHSKKYWQSTVEVLSSLGFENPELEARFLDVFIDGIWINNFIDEEDFPLNDMKEFLLQRYSKEGIKKLIT